MVNGSDATREFIVYRDSALAPDATPIKPTSSKFATQTSSSMTSTSMSARSSAVASSSSGAPSKPYRDMSRLRKLVSIGYYSYKVKHWFQREDRDTIVCEDDDEETTATTHSGDALLAANPHSVASAFYASWIEANAMAAKTAATAAPSTAVAMAPIAPLSVPLELKRVGAYEPSKEQRWCTNCAKCFQRSLSHYDQFCGLDCRTAHRFRVAA